MGLKRVMTVQLLCDAPGCLESQSNGVERVEDAVGAANEETTVVLTEAAISRGWAWNEAGDQIFCWQHRPLPDDLPAALQYWASVWGENTQKTVELQTAVAESNVFAGVNGPPRNREAFFRVMDAYRQWRLREDEIEATLDLCAQLLNVCLSTKKVQLGRLIHVLLVDTNTPEHRKQRAIQAIGESVVLDVVGFSFQQSLTDAYNKCMTHDTPSNDKRLFLDLLAAALRWQVGSEFWETPVWRKSIEASLHRCPVPATKPKSADDEPVPGCPGRPEGAE